MTATATAQMKMSRPAPQPMNGVNTPILFATIDAVAGQPALAKFTFRASNHWISGTHSRSTINGYYGAGDEQMRERTFTMDADHTTVLCGGDEGPTPVEFLLHALAACLTAGIGNIASARGITLHEVESTVEGDIDLRGILGISDEVRNGYQAMRASFRIRGNAPPEKLKQVMEQACARSAVLDVLTNGMSVTIDVDAG